MSKEFEIVFEGDFPGTPEQLWDAVIVQTAAWLFPTDGELGEELISDAPHHHLNRMESDGWFNQVEQIITAGTGGGSHMRWVHSGIFTDDWDNQYDGARKHTDFYMHTLGQYLEFFAPRSAMYVDVQGPESSAAFGSFEVVRRALGIGKDMPVDGRTTVGLPDLPTGSIVDYNNDRFIGLRTADALYRFFGRDAFGAPIGITVHSFGDASPSALETGWQRWLDGLFG